MRTVNCPRCGKPAGAGLFYCRQCGAKVRSWLLSSRFIVPVSLGVVAVVAVSWAVATLVVGRVPAAAPPVVSPDDPRVLQLERELASTRAEVAKAAKDQASLRSEIAPLQLGSSSTSAALADLHRQMSAVRSDVAAHGKSSAGAQGLDAKLAEAMARLEQVEKRMSGLAVGGASRGPAVGAGGAAAEAGAAGDKNLTANWKLLSDALAQNEKVSQARVRETLGPPDSVENYAALRKSVWRYRISAGVSGSVTIEDGVLSGVDAPRLP